MALKLPAALRSARADAITARAGNGAKLRVYAGARPADADTAVGSQVLLAELVCASPFAPASVSGVLTVGAIAQDVSADASGQARWFRIVTSAGTTVVLDGSVTATGGGGDLQLATVNIVAGRPLDITSFVLTEGGA